MWASDATEAARPDSPAPPRSDDDFVRGLRAGRPEAFELLFALYRTQIYNLARRTLHDAEEAEDATQETFLKAFQQIPRQNGDLQLEPWLYRVAVNTCFDHLRTRRRRPTTPLAEQAEQASPTDQFAQAETGRLVEETLKRLSERHRVALVLKDLHGFTHEEIGAVLGISRGAAETLLFRARESFRSVFEGLSPVPEGNEGCAYARSVALALVGRDVSPVHKRELVEHAKRCPACRRSLQLRGGLALGLGLFVRELAPPAAMGSSVAFAASGPPAAALGGAGSAGVLAKVAALFAGKAAIVTIAAAGVTLAGGTAAYTQLHSGHGANGHGALAGAVTNATSHGQSASADRATHPGAGRRASHARLSAAHAKAKGKAVAAKADKRAASKKDARGGKGAKTGDGKQRGPASGRGSSTATKRQETPAETSGHEGRSEAARAGHL
jgi:RNA polymerase sigma-70 factor, ECF subfamily